MACGSRATHGHPPLPRHLGIRGTACPVQQQPRMQRLIPIAASRRAGAPSDRASGLLHRPRSVTQWQHSPGQRPSNDMMFQESPDRGIPCRYSPASHDECVSHKACLLRSTVTCYRGIYAKLDSEQTVGDAHVDIRPIPSMHTSSDTVCTLPPVIES